MSKKRIKYRRQKFSINEFDESLLPSNRFKQFFDIFKIEWSSLLRIGFIFLLFLIPLVAVTLIKGIVTPNILNAVKSNGGGQDEINYVSSIINVVYYGVCSICFLIFSLALAGVSKIVQNICYGEGVLFRNDFLVSLKENWKRFMLFALIGSFCFFLIKFNESFFASYSGFGFKMIIYLTSFIFYIFVLPIVFFSMSNQVSYKMKISECLSNGYKFTSVKILFSLIFSLVIYAFTFITKINHPVILTAVLIFAIIVIFPLYFLAHRLFALYINDEYINKENYPEIYRKGLKPLLPDTKGE